MSRAEADVEVEQVEDDQPLRWYVVAAFMLAVSAGFALAVWFTVAWFSNCEDSGKTGTATSYAGDSMRNTLCHSGHGAAGLLVPGGWVLGVVLATFALLRWGGGGARLLLLGVLLLTPAALPAVAYGGLGLSGTGCTGERLTAYRAWAEEGSKGTPPYDCRTF